MDIINPYQVHSTYSMAAPASFWIFTRLPASISGSDNRIAFQYLPGYNIDEKIFQPEVRAIL